MASEQQQSILLYEAECVVFDEMIQLRFSLESDSSYMLSRRIDATSGASFTQLITIEDLASLHDFSTSDPFESKLRNHYAKIRDLFNRNPLPCSRVLHIIDPVEAIGSVSACKTKGELHNLVRAITYKLGSTQFVFHWLRSSLAGDSPATDARYLIGCRPSWIQQYITRVFYLHDQHLHYAKSNLAAALTSSIGRNDDWVGQEAKRHGFVNGLVVPAHSPKTGFFGFLHIGNSLDRSTGEDSLLRSKPLFVALSVELLEWRVAELRREAAWKFRLSAEDVSVLQIYGKRRSVEDVAAQLRTTREMGYKHFQRINKKLGVKRIQEALSKASDFFLVD